MAMILRLAEDLIDEILQSVFADLTGKKKIMMYRRCW
jgi:hypothetical protein